MKIYYYTVRDRKGNAVLFKDKLRAETRTEARQIILDVARRDTPGGRGRSPRDYGYVPVSDYHITFDREEER